jgi:outer membrane receptor for ferrienterochelin and colicin
MTRHSGRNLWACIISLAILEVIFTVSSAGKHSDMSWAAEPQSSPEKELQLFLKEESVNISARYEQPISQAAANVYVITDEDIRHSGATDIPTLLRRIPGIEVIQVSGADFDVSARGDNQLQSNKMLVLVDGRSIYDDTQGVVLWKVLPVTLPEIKRIEVLKGPASVLYGFNAFDGVVNIITKSPEEIKGTTVQFGGGEYGTITSAAIEAGTYGKFGYRLSIGHDQNNKWSDRNAVAYRADRFNVHTEYALSGMSKVLLSGGIVKANRFDGPITDIINGTIKPEQLYVDSIYERPDFYVRGYWNRINEPGAVPLNPLLAPFLMITDRDGRADTVFHSDSYSLETQRVLELGQTNRLAAGAQYRHNALSFNFIDHFSREDRLGLYFEDEWRATQQLTFVAGLRFDLHTEINPTYSPRIALLYRPIPDHTIRLAGSVAYRPPTIFETHLESHGSVCVFGTFPACGFAVPIPVLHGSSNLNPEEITSYELGYQGWYFKHRLRLRIDLFYNHISNLINTGGDPVEFFNGPNADIHGGEAGFEYLATTWLSTFANFSYQDIGQTFTGLFQRAGPRFKANAGVRGEWENGLNAEVVINHVGAVTYPVADTYAAFGVQPPEGRVGSYNLLNLRGAYKFWKERAEVAVTAFNALNDRHREHPVGEIIGSRVMAWLTIRY